MHTKVFYTYTVILFFLVIPYPVLAQQKGIKQDTFFLANKKGLLGRFGKMISTNTPEIEPEKVENQFLKFKGKIIRSINLVSLSFGCNIYDTCEVSSNLGIDIANRFHKNSKQNTISRNLFFRTGDKFAPYLVADNERYLRELVYIKDARILVDYSDNNTDSVDVVVLTKDVFSIGGKLAINNIDRGRAELKEENFAGTGSSVLVSSFYDRQRQPRTGFGGEIVKRNIRGSFIDWTTGFQNYNTAFNSDSNRNDETSVYTTIEKPLVTPYIPSTGALQIAYHKTNNTYIADSLYRSDYQYKYYNVDAWFGYSLDSKRSLYANKEIRVHRFIAARVFKQRFISLPVKFKTTYDYRFTDFTGTLASLNIFKQTFYKTNFIYGFGISEDIPEGFTVALTAGFINKQTVKRPYSGIDFQFTNFKKRGLYNNYIFRVGGYYNDHRFEDVDLLFQMEHFTRLKKLSPSWFLRTFITTSITAQVNPVLNPPLFLNSIYGLPYFNNADINADMRATCNGESVFFSTKKLLGFRFAPFIFSNVSLLKPSKMDLKHSDIFSAVGGGIRTRNENLIFGTIELKGYYFPRRNGDMNDWKIELNSNIRFKYKSNFINRPDFIVDN